MSRIAVNLGTAVRPDAYWLGPALPFNKNPKGVFAPKTTREVVWSSIVNILYTPMGSRVMNREFGSLLNQLVFSPNDTATLRLAENYVIAAIEKWEPRVRILRANVQQGVDFYNLRINIQYVIISENVTEDRSLDYAYGSKR